MEELSEEGAAEVAKLRSLSRSSPPLPSAACSPLGATRPGVGLFTFGVHVARCARVRQLDRRLLEGVVTRSDPCARSSGSACTRTRCLTSPRCRGRLGPRARAFGGEIQPQMPQFPDGPRLCRGSLWSFETSVAL